MTTRFYRAFEDKHRGTRELIKARLRVYLPFVRPLAAAHPELPVLDLGCGRGEWLELLLENNIAAHGVDLDQGMLAACSERGLSASSADAIEHLSALADHSQLAVTGFHLAEHLPFAVLQTLLAQARRVLVPGGLLILETPNPENLVVGTASFYIDPTHLRPLPSQLLSFLAEYQGFDHVKLLRLQQEAHLAENGPASLYDVLANVSPDYAIVAQAALHGDGGQVKQRAHTEALQQAFAPEYGLSLYTLASRYDEHLHQQLATLHQQQAHLQQQLAALHQQQARLQQQQADLRDQNQAQLQATHAAQRQTEEALAVAHHSAARADEFAAALSALHASHSWRLTRPLRWLVRLLRGGPRQG